METQPAPPPHTRGHRAPRTRTELATWIGMVSAAMVVIQGLLFGCGEDLVYIPPVAAGFGLVAAALAFVVHPRGRLSTAFVFAAAGACLGAVAWYFDPAWPLWAEVTGGAILAGLGTAELWAARGAWEPL